MLVWRRVLYQQRRRQLAARHVESSCGHALSRIVVGNPQHDWQLSVELSADRAAAMVASDDSYLATERTFLAWVRTALALLGFGLVVSRFFVSTFGGSLLRSNCRVARCGLSVSEA
eukprot:m.371670 g.371670  ORF g.371670 m.371670 type:complete len:116 (-) comp19991_c0_seq44:4589-4936(-)